MDPQESQQYVVSIVIPCLNWAATLRETVESAQEQSYSNT